MKKTEKGFLIRTRAKVEYLGDARQDEDLYLVLDGKKFYFSDITSTNADDNFSLVKKIVVQVKWSLTKGKDPIEDKNAKTMFLVGFKSDIEG